MPNEQHQKLFVTLAELGFGTNFANLDWLPDDDMAWSDQVTDCEDCERVEIFARIKTGTSPTAGAEIAFFVARADDDGTDEIRAGDEAVNPSTGTQGTAAVVDRVEAQVEYIGSIVVDATSNKDYNKRFQFFHPGADWNLVVINRSGAALNSTGSPHLIRYRGWGPEIQ